MAATFVRGDGRTLEHDDVSLRTDVKRLHWERSPARPHAQGEKMLRMLRKEDEFYEFFEDERRGEDVDAEQHSEDALMLAGRDK